MIWTSPIILGKEVHTLTTNFCPQPLTVPTPHRSTISLSYSHHYPAGVGILNRTKKQKTKQLEPSKPITLELKLISLLEPPSFAPATVCSFSDYVIIFGKPMQTGMGII